MTRILWQGRPDARIRASDLLSRQTLIGLGFLAIGGLAMTVFGPPQGGASCLIGAVTLSALGVFVLIGAFLALWVITGAWVRRITRYRLTEDGAEIETRLWGLGVTRRTPWAEMNHLALIDGTPGSVVFRRGLDRVDVQRALSAPPLQAARQTAPMVVETGFERIPDARAVHALISRQRSLHRH